MQVYGEEGKKRVERHRRLRAGKGFITSEQTVQIEQALKKFKDSDKMSYVALVECVSNLTANEMFDENGQRSEGRSCKACCVWIKSAVTVSA